MLKAPLDQRLGSISSLRLQQFVSLPATDDFASLSKRLYLNRACLCELNAIACVQSIFGTKHPCLSPTIVVLSEYLKTGVKCKYFSCRDQLLRGI